MFTACRWFLICQLCLVAGFIFVLPAHGQEKPQSDPTALALFDEALERLEAKSATLRKWQYQQVLTTHQFDSDDEVIGKGTWRYILRTGEDDPIEYLDESEEGKLTFFKDEAPKKEEMTAPGKAGTEKGEASSGDESSTRIESVGDAIRKYSLRERFVWTCLPDEKAAGENAAVIAFAPKLGQSTKTREQRFLGLLAGKIWISREDFTVLKAEGELQSPYRLFWIIARVTKLRFLYEVAPNPASRLLRPSHAEAETVVVFPFNTVRQKHWLEVEKFEPRTKRKVPKDK